MPTSLWEIAVESGATGAPTMHFIEPGVLDYMVSAKVA
jgi:hypothetical protein